MTNVAYAVSDESSSSPHYEFIESDVGDGGLIPASSANYQSVESVGDAAVGNSSSTSYQFQAGSQTTKDPSLTLDIINDSASFGTFNPETPSTATAQFSVIDYTSYGYMVQLIGNPPKYNNHTIPAMSNDGGPTTSTPGTEQFGINLVANTSPTVGSNPNYGQFGATSAKPTDNYDTSNEFYYPSDGSDTIAESPKSSGEIIYTISYLVNVAGLTPGGQYTSDQTIVVTGTF